MGKWKKAVAALAAVPMLMALAPAANAVESDPTDSSAAQRALAAALKSKPRQRQTAICSPVLISTTSLQALLALLSMTPPAPRRPSTVLPQWLPARTALLQFGSVLDSG